MWDTHRSRSHNRSRSGVGVGVGVGAGVGPEAGDILKRELEPESCAGQWPEPNLLSTYVTCVGNKLFIRVCLLQRFQLLGHIIYFIIFSYFCFHSPFFSRSLSLRLLAAVCSVVRSLLFFHFYLATKYLFIAPQARRDETKSNCVMHAN